MRANEQFKRGDRVRLTEKGLKLFGKDARSVTGTVIGFSRDLRHVRIARDLYKEPGIWDVSFWEKDLSNLESKGGEQGCLKH